MPEYLGICSERTNKPISTPKYPRLSLGALRNVRHTKAYLSSIKAVTRFVLIPVKD